MAFVMHTIERYFYHRILIIIKRFKACRRTEYWVYKAVSHEWFFQLLETFFNRTYWPLWGQNSGVGTLTGSPSTVANITFTVHDGCCSTSAGSIKLSIDTDITIIIPSPTATPQLLQLLFRFTACHWIPHNASSPWMPRVAANINRQDSAQENIRFLFLPRYSI